MRAMRALAKRPAPGSPLLRWFSWSWVVSGHRHDGRPPLKALKPPSESERAVVATEMWARRKGASCRAASSRPFPPPETGAPGRRSGAGLGSKVGLAQQIVDVQAAREHGQRALRGARPSRLRLVPAQLDPVLVGIAQVQRLAHAVVGRSVERNARRD